MPFKKHALTERQMLFVRAYKKCGNATQSAIAAGYSKKTSNEQGSRLLANVSVQAALQQVEEKLQHKFDITLERIVQELAAIAFGSAGNLMEWSEESMTFIPKKDLKPHEMCFVDTVSIGQGERGATLKMTTLAREKVKALEAMARLLGLDQAASSEKNQLTAVFAAAMVELKKEK